LAGAGARRARCRSGRARPVRDRHRAGEGGGAAMTEKPLTIGVIAGEVSGDLLGGDLIAALRAAHAGPVALVGGGGEALEREGLKSLFDFSELSIMGISQVLKRLPALIRRIRQTADALIAARPDVLLIIDSPDFTHRVAR